ncbi:VWA domain-containing protein [Tumebacillus lipolyticus]|uniref:VWA domain-containing protein n=1 Tax=Tumebacillus lipolyticus TaxID=1280370 RepID=A0ABW4ZX14_9BACL
MSIDLKKKAEANLIDLSKKANISLAKKGLGSQKARVALCLDISGSMQELYRRGVVQDVTEKLLALAMNFDDNCAADVFLFGVKDYEVGEIEQSNFFQFVDREILSRYALEGGTRYGGVIKRVADHYFPGAVSVEKKGFFGFGAKKGISVDTSKYRNEEPVYVLFITDGDNQDKDETTKMITEVSKLGIFWQFVGVGNSGFAYLDKLDNLDGRFIDNANFFKVPKLDKITDDQLYDQLLNEFPAWLKEAKEKALIK